MQDRQTHATDRPTPGAVTDRQRDALVPALLCAGLTGFGLALALAALVGGWSIALWPAVLTILIGLGGLVYTVRRQPKLVAMAPPEVTVPQAVVPPPAPTPLVTPAPAPRLTTPLILPSSRSAGPRIVAIGGGTGMPQLLRGLRAYTDEITAIVTVADDGGSSGRLRRQMGVLPPGDFRNNIAALSQAEELMTRLFQYRFADNDVGGQSSELAGHSFGNLFITTMAAVTGSFEAGLAESSRVLAVRGRVLPSTLEHITLCGELCFTAADGTESWQIVEGESNITESGGRILRVFLKPDQPRAYPAVIRAILQADLILAGPGSFFTSVMPNLLVPAVRDAIESARAPRIYLCNVATQKGETDGYSVADHMRQLRYHAGNAFPMVLANSKYDPTTRPASNADWVPLPPPDEPQSFRLFTGDVVDDAQPWRHHPGKLAARVMEIYAELTAGDGAPTQPAL
jgi:uncharacterized cofD-like protein